MVNWKDSPSTADLAGRWMALRNRDRLTHAEAASRLGVTTSSLVNALSRARRDGILPKNTRRNPHHVQRLEIRDALEEWGHLKYFLTEEEAARRLGVPVHTLTHNTLEAS